MKNIKKDFELFAKDKGIKPSITHDVIKSINDSTINPYILEERKLNVTQMDIYSRLMMDRIIYFGSDFNSDACNVMLCQLLYLSSVDNRDINVYINSPGGSVYDGLAVIDTMNYIDCDVSTTVAGMAASMGAVLLSSGTKGKRFALPHSRIMIHQPSGGMRGSASDMKIEYEEMMKCRKDLYNILAKNMNKSFEEIEALCDRDKWFLSNEAVEIGIIDKVLERKNE